MISSAVIVSYSSHLKGHILLISCSELRSFGISKITRGHRQCDARGDVHVFIPASTTTGLRTVVL